MYETSYSRIIDSVTFVLNHINFKVKSSEHICIRSHGDFSEYLESTGSCPVKGFTSDPLLWNCTQTVTSQQQKKTIEGLPSDSAAILWISISERGAGQYYVH